ncbi:MAG: hypothetical protein A3C53_07765 [Omnitrophica WOR_2 bacterium RIFCSPHIGHO2_02_FULL_68_15]|nr:MAG: hypothetical protein A3C53_07765 [Omnitrophica WOR_2 bacterium RIFCSPHIGHO2_02_FULL_68_15]
MPLATMTSKGQVTIPKAVREQLHLEPHDTLIVLAEGDRAMLRPVRGTILGLKGVLHRKGMKPINFRKLRARFEEGMATEAVRRGRLAPPTP